MSAINKPIKKILIIGGTGLLGSSICRSALNKGYQVLSLTRTGKPFITSDGFTPPWVEKVKWYKGTPFTPSTYSHLLKDCTAVVSTLGILLESNYKSTETKQVNPLNLLKGLTENLLGNKGNPLNRGGVRKEGDEEITYEKINRDAALAMYDTYASTLPSPTIASLTSTESTPLSKPSQFIYISAEDIFRPFIPSRYISTKREAERILLSKDLENSLDPTKRQIKTTVIRPSLIYHPHLSPISTLPASILSLSAHIQSSLPTPLRIASLFPSKPFNSPSAPLPTPLVSLSNLLTLEPIHSDTISEAVLKVLEGEWEGGSVLGVRDMRKLAGFSDEIDREQEERERARN